MKTPMQELFEWLENSSNIENDILNWETIKVNALEKEKKQITDACWYGHDIKHEYFNPIHYFDQTYNQNK